MKQKEPTFYVYVLVRPDGRPFYVGKGKGRRVEVHEREARSGHRCRKCNIIRKIWRSGGEVQRYIVFRTDDEQEAFIMEREYIALHGRKNLCNLTDGGDGFTADCNPWSSSERRARMLESRRDLAYRRKMSDIQSAPERRKKQSERSKRLWSDPAYRQKMANLLSERHRSGEFSQKSPFSDIWSDHDRGKTMAAKISAGLKGKAKSEEHRTKIAASVKAAHARRRQETQE